jgi:diguanylate cyclase (GGDEF)-like protein
LVDLTSVGALAAVQPTAGLPPEDVRLRSLAEMSRVLGRSSDLLLTVERAAEEALRALLAASVSVSRLEPGTDSVRVLINVGDLGPTETRRPTDERYRLSDYQMLSRVVHERRVWIASEHDRDLDERELRLLRDLCKGSAMGAPLLVDGVLWGELYATRHVGARAFSEAEHAYIEALAAILGSALARVMHVEKLESLAFRDPLTDLANRRALVEAGRRALEDHAEHGTPVSTVVVDVDGLKQINDSVGHVEGDRVLCGVAVLLVRAFSELPGALVARVGGDEFCMLVAGRPREDVETALHALDARSCPLPHGATLSCGVASTDDRARASSFDELFAAADAAQYRAKRAGGGQVRSARPAVIMHDRVDHALRGTSHA